MQNAMFCAAPGDCAESLVPLVPGGAYRGTVISYQWRVLSPAPRWRPCTPTASVAFPAAMSGRLRWSGAALAGLRPARSGAGGLVNVAWDGGVHTFIIDAVVAWPLRRRPAAPVGPDAGCQGPAAAPAVRRA